MLSFAFPLSTTLLLIPFSFLSLLFPLPALSSPLSSTLLFFYPPILSLPPPLFPSALLPPPLYLSCTLSTNPSYVSRLELIAVTFYNQVDDFNTKNKQVIPPSDVQQMFLNIRQIHQLNQNILQELQTRMANWYVM